MTEQTATTADLDAMLRKIRGLLAVADDDATPEAAKPAYRAKAEAMMVKFRISEEQAYESMPASDRITISGRKFLKKGTLNAVE